MGEVESLITDEQWDRAVALLWSTEAGQRWWGYNGGGSASPKAKNYLRDLLRRNAGNADAEALRAFFNEHRRTHDRICRRDVAAAIECLKRLESQKS